MHPRKLWLAIGLSAACAVQAAVVYKWVDADGVIHYSDPATHGAEKIFTSAPNSASAGSARSPAGPSQAPQSNAAGGLDYTEFSIAAPSNDQTFFGDDVVAVRLNLAPSLKPNQNITWHLNGTQLDANGLAFTMPHLDRGTYNLAATITDQRTGESQTSNSVTFFVRQPSALAPQHK
ncbi:MAG TPA: DUF4124 domain-containing protein [Steroidobacteraceae bacterium]